MSKIKELVVENEECYLQVEALERKLASVISGLEKINTYHKDGRAWLADLQCELLLQELGVSVGEAPSSDIPQIRGEEKEE